MGASLVAQMVKHLPAMWKTRVPSLGQEDPLEKEMASHFSTLAWRTMDRGAWWVIVHRVAHTCTRKTGIQIVNDLIKMLSL